MSPPPTMQPASPPSSAQTVVTQTSQMRVNGGQQQSLNTVVDKMANTIPVTKRSPKDYIFGKVIGEGSYSTVRCILCTGWARGDGRP